MKYLEAIILGIVQGITEFLPVSSSGHLSIVQFLFGKSVGEANHLFQVVLHLGTFAAVVLCFWKDVWGVFKEFFLGIADIFRGKFSWKNANFHRRTIILMVIASLFLFLVLPFHDFAEGLNTNMFVVGISLLATGVLLFASDKYAPKAKRTGDEATVKDAAVIGSVQACSAIFPGLSRSGSTISTGLFLGLDRDYAVTFSFLLSLPAVCGAVFLETLDAVKEGVPFDPSYLVGMLVAFLAGIGAIALVKWLVKSDRFGKFCWYCFAVGLFAVGLGLYKIFA